MRTVFASISLVLSLLVGYLYFQNKNQQRDLAQAYNALRDLKWQQERNRNELYKSWTEIGEKPLELNDSIVEIHRIWSTQGVRIYVLRLESRKDGSLWSVLKQFSIKHPLTGEGKTEVLASRSRFANPVDLTVFKAQLSKIQLSTAAISDQDIMCCFGGGSITWEAKMPDGEMYTFSTFCRKSIEFTKSCEALLEKYGVSDLEAMHK